MEKQNEQDALVSIENQQKEIKQLLDTVKTNIESPDELSKLLVELSSLRFYIGGLHAQAGKEYAEAVLKALYSNPAFSPGDPPKKVSVAEAERQADVVTSCQKDLLKNRMDSLDEVVNSIKVRIRVLQGEKDMSGGAGF